MKPEAKIRMEGGMNITVFFFVWFVGFGEGVVGICDMA